jgi:hypothetical protein
MGNKVIRNKLLHKIAIIVISAAFWLLIPKSVLADTGIVTCPSGDQGFDTAIGCVPFVNSSGEANTNSIAAFFLKWGLGVAGGVAFVLMVFAAFQIMTSSGDPRRLQAGKELLTSAIAGLLLIIFSVYILRIVGVDILKIPGLEQ